MTGLFKDIPENTRQTIIQTVISAQKKTVKFERGSTRCPVCEMFGLTSKIAVRSTQGEVRYCECLRCSTNFVAIADEFQKAEKIVNENKTKYVRIAKNKKRKKM